MKLEHALGGIHSGITRVLYTPAGYLVEADGTGKASDYVSFLFDELFQYVINNGADLIYRLYIFDDTHPRFVIPAVLRQVRTSYNFNMSTSVVGGNDIYCLFTEFDFDYLTLSGENKGKIHKAFFVLDKTLNTRLHPNLTYRELDIMGHQLEINSTPIFQDSCYSINVPLQDIFNR